MPNKSREAEVVIIKRRNICRSLFVPEDPTKRKAKIIKLLHTHAKHKLKQPVRGCNGTDLQKMGEDYGKCLVGDTIFMADIIVNGEYHSFHY